MKSLSRAGHAALAAVLGLVGGEAMAATPVAPAPTAAQPAPPAAPVGLAVVVFPAKDARKLTVTSPAFADGGDIPTDNTRWGANIFPGLTWTKSPGVRSYVVVMQDADVNYQGGPLLHWTMYAIAAAVTALAPGMAAPPSGASYGPNVRGPDQPYMGPHTPVGARHHYHFAVLGLDRAIPVDPQLSWNALASDIAGHVVASGEVVGIGQAPPGAQQTTPTPPAPKTAAP